MPLKLTLILLGVSVVLAVFCGWRGARAPDLSRGPRLIPWRFLLMVFTFATVVLTVHAIQASMGQG